MIINEKRALAYIKTIDEIRPLEGYDRVEYARTGGWWCIVGKDEFKVGDKAIYFEIDSLVPADDERFAFLAKRNFRIKTQKMCKVVSQGLLMPLKDFPECAGLDEFTDVTDKLGIIYYEPEDNKRKGEPDPNMKYKSMAARHAKLFRKKPIRWLMRREWGKKLLFVFFGKKKDKPTSFPNFPYVKKTDEERIENLPQLLGYPHPLTVTEKLDGTSCTYVLERKKRGKFEFYVSSRNVRQLNPDQECFHETNIYWELAKKYNIEENLKEYLQRHPDVEYVCVQGEGVGTVQGNPLKLKENDLYLFNFIDSKKGRFTTAEGVETACEMGFKWVPILDIEFYMPDDMEEFKQMATGSSCVNRAVMREGIVLRDEKGLSFKNVSREYLMGRK